MELGIPGLLLLTLFLGGVGEAARRAVRRSHPLAAGASAVCLWLLHASIDWDWQMPAATLPAMVLAGGLLAASEPAAAERLQGSPAASQSDGRGDPRRLSEPVSA